jgi:hypothetical protein
LCSLPTGSLGCAVEKPEGNIDWNRPETTGEIFPHIRGWNAPYVVHLCQSRDIKSVKQLNTVIDGEKIMWIEIETTMPKNIASK